MTQKRIMDSEELAELAEIDAAVRHRSNAEILSAFDHHASHALFQSASPDEPFDISFVNLTSHRHEVRGVFFLE